MEAVTITGKYDVIVVGTGPAGSVVAMKCAQEGLKTLVLERQTLPRFKLCGGGVPKWVIEKLGVPEDIIERKTDTMVFMHSPHFEPEELKAPVWQAMVHRDKFDGFLAKSAEEAGAELREGVQVLKVIKKQDTVKGVTTKQGDIFADIVIGCDGAASTVARTAGFWNIWFNQQGSTWKNHMSFCVGTDIEMDEELIFERIGFDRILFFMDPKVSPLGYSWIFPKERSVTVGLLIYFSAIISSPVEHLNYFIRKHPVASKLLESGKVGRTRGAYLPIKHVFRPSYASGLMLAGDSAGMVSAITGEGIIYAVRAGWLAGLVASKAVEEKNFEADFLKEYEEHWYKKFGEKLDKVSRLFEENLGVYELGMEKPEISSLYKDVFIQSLLF